MPQTRYRDAKPLSDDFARFCNQRDYTVADVQSDSQLRESLQDEFDYLGGRAED